MPIVNSRIEFLRYHQEAIPELAQAFYTEWRHLIPEMTLLDLEQSIRMGINTDSIPLILVALNETGDWIGSATLIAEDLDSRPDLFPWLANLYVKPAFRSRGLARDLITAILKIARSLGFHHVYLYSETLKTFYEKLGWETIEEQIYHGTGICIMQYSFTAKDHDLEKRSSV